jgi:uncharacterized repeat protein (TIGR02543 family)
VIIIGLLALTLVSSQIFVVFGDEPAGKPAVPLPDAELIGDVTAEPVPDAEFDGYIVSVEKATGVDKKALAKTADAVIDSTTAVIAEPEDVLKYTDAANVAVIEPNYKLTVFGDAAGADFLNAHTYTDMLGNSQDWSDADTDDTGETPVTGEMPDVGISSTKFPEADPADPIYRDENDYQWGLKTINTCEAWKGGYRGAGVTIAVLDTGINSSHEDLNPDSIVGQKFFSGSKGTSYSDDNGHGTYVASIIAAQTNNMPKGKGRGMAGITDEADLIIYKVLGKSGEGYVSDLISAYTALLDTDVDIVNMSFGHPGYLTQEDEIVQKLIAGGIIVVAAVGNEGESAGAAKNQICYPAAYDNVIGVGSCNSDGKASGFSSKNDSVDVSAPGENMAGLSGFKNSVYKVGGKGTSFATPVVAAAAAIARQINPELTADDFLTLLKATVNDAGTKGYDSSFGYGVLDIGAIIESLEAAATVATVPASGAGPGDVTGVDGTARPVLKASQKSILVNFNATGGKVSQTNRAVFIGSGYGKLPVPTKKSYKFLGWYTKKKGGDKIAEAGKVTATKDQTLYAHWVKTYTVKFNSVGGSKIAKKIVENKKAVSKLLKPTKKGYKFRGWYTKKKGGKKISKKTKIKRNVTYYAHWKKR